MATASLREPQAGHGPAWTAHIDGDDVTFRFEGFLDKVEGRRSARRMAHLLAERPRHVTFQVSDMDGYANEARREWIRSLSPLRRRILSIHCHGGNVFVRLGARTLGMALGIHVECT